MRVPIHLFWLCYGMTFVRAELMAAHGERGAESRFNEELEAVGDRTRAADVRNEDSPLWQLFGNIWHQGTVYEATSYAVPFMISLAADPATPDRAGILGLLAAIAQGNSYLAVHERFLRQQRTMNAIVRAMDVQGLAFRTPFSCYGLPDSRRGLRRMAAGSDPQASNMMRHFRL